jgi:glycyl-tRNA synthetase
METLYDKNGLVFWNEAEIRVRQTMVDHFKSNVFGSLKTQNRAWEFVQVEAPLLMPAEWMNQQYLEDDSAFRIRDESLDLALRPETTYGSYVAARRLLETHSGYRLPLCVWQHGKSFRAEQDQPSKHMRLKEFYQLEFQCIYALGTMCDYSLKVIPAVRQCIAEFIGPCRVEASDRIPAYAEWTQDIVCEKTNMEVCSISLRKDYRHTEENGQLCDAHVLEVAIGTDRCVYNFFQKDT